MKEILFILLIAFWSTSCSQIESHDLAIQDVTIFDSRTKTILPNKTILIRADTIAAIISSSEGFAAKTTVSGKGRLITPGFIDTHTHLKQNYRYSENSEPEFIPKEDYDLLRNIQAYHYMRHGATTIIDMGQPETWMDLSLDWQNNPSPQYPNYYFCGGAIVSDEDRRQPSHHIEVKDPEDGRKKVRDYAAKGLKYMKFYSKLKGPDMAAMADEAIKQNIIVNTHVDNNRVTIDEALGYGILNFEHFFTVIPSILDYDIHWPLMNEKYGIEMNSSIDEFAAHMVYFFGYIKENPDFNTKLLALFDRMAASGATLSTAINVLASSTDRTDFFTSFEYFPIRRSPSTKYSIEQTKQLEFSFDAMMDYVKIAHDKGVKIRIGTDCRFGGESMLRELILFSKAGIPTEDILQIATLNGYESMRLEDSRGSIEVGKKADLVIFNKNPFDDVKNFLSGKTVIKDGKVFSMKKSRSQDLLDKMVDEGTQKATAWYEASKTDNTYASTDPTELKHTFRQLIGTGKVDEGQAVHYIYNTSFPNKALEIDGNLLINSTYAVLREQTDQKAIDFYKFTQDEFPAAETTLPLAVLISLIEKDIGTAKETFDALKDDKRYIFEEGEMNGVGYLLLQKEKIKGAIEIFKMNVEAFPDSWNAYDSLGEGYMTNGDKELAIQFYEKSIELNPENEYGKEQVKKLKKG